MIDKKEIKNKVFIVLIAYLISLETAQAKWYVGIETGYTAVIDHFRSHTTGSGNAYFLQPKLQDFGNAFKNQSWQDGKTQYAKEPYLGPNISFNFGTEHFTLKNYLGIRWGIMLGYTHYTNYTSTKTQTIWGESTGKITDEFDYLDLGFALDSTINILVRSKYSIGIFGGAQLDYHYLINRDYYNSINKTHLNTNSQSSRHSADLTGRVGITSLFVNHHRLDLIFKLPIGSILLGNEEKVYLLPAFPTLNFNVSYKYLF